MRWLPLVLLACVEPPLSQRPPPGAEGLLLGGPEVVHPGDDATWTVTAYDLLPGRRIFLGWGSTLGQGPCPPAAGGLCVDLADPRPITSVVSTPRADNPALGEAIFALRVPPGVAAPEVHLQALLMDGADSASSNPLTVEMVPADCDLVSGLCNGEQPTLVAHWPLDDPMAHGPRDVGPHGLHGRFIGAPWVDCEGARHFDRVDDRVQIADDDRLDIEAPMTVSAWIRTRFTTVSQRIVAKHSWGLQDGWEMSLSSTGTPFVRFNQASTGNDIRVDSPSLPLTDTWTHLATTWDSRTLRLYVDGQLVDQQPVTTPPAANDLPLGIGADGDGDRPMLGTVADVRIYRGALSAGAIASLGDRGAIGAWPLDGVGTDASVDQRDALLQPGASWDIDATGDFLALDGAGYATIEGAQAMSPARGFVVSASVRPDRVATQRVLSKQLPYLTDGFELSLSSNGTVFGRLNQTSWNNIARVDSTRPYPTDGSWMQVELAYDGAELSLHIDGVEEGRVPIAAGAFANDLPLTLGADPDGGFALQGGLRDVTLRTRAGGCLPASPQAQITALEPIPDASRTHAKPQHKVFAHLGRTYAVLSDPGGTWIWRLDDTVWVRDHLLSPSTTAEADVLVDGDVAHVLLFDGLNTELVSVVYGAGSQTDWGPWPLAIGAVPLPLPTDAETATLAKDGTGRLWAAWEDAGLVRIAWADAPFTAFTIEAAPLAAGLDNDDLALVTSLAGGVAVLWSNQTTGLLGMRVHADGDPADQWSVDEQPPGVGLWYDRPTHGGFADDHLNAALASDGTLYVAIKTSYNQVDYPVLMLLVRESDGTWHPADDAYRLDRGEVDQTRPVVAVSEDQVVVAYTDRSDSTIRYRVASRTPVIFGPEQVGLRAADIDDATLQRGWFSDRVVVLASDGNQTHGMHVELR